MRARRAAALAVMALVACVAGMFVAGPAYAGFSERIVDYRSDVTIEPDGTIEVHETIVYDFGVVPKHGIFRFIPVRTEQSGKDGYDRVYPLTVVSVSGSAGTPAQYSVEEDGDNQRIKIGDPDQTISGEHTYDIVYRVRGEMNAFADHDELVWNAVGTEWPVPIDKASATVHGPADFTQVGCNTGQFGATFPCDTATSSGPTAEFSKAPLNPYEGMTFAVALPKGAVVPAPRSILEERFSFTSAFRVTPATGGISGGLLAVLALIVIFLVFKFGRDRRYAGSAVDAAYGKDGGPEVSAPLHEGETPVEFEPPEHLRPGELGTVIDGGILLLIASRWMPKRTAKGYAVLRHTLGFKRFIDESEKHRAQFAERANIFSEYLPYAVVFGATEKWAKAFEGLADDVDTSSWYVSQHAFNYAVFSSAIDGFAVTSAGTLTSSPASSGSSGFSGGGFSGGGGGGGGGGSW